MLVTTVKASLTNQDAADVELSLSKEQLLDIIDAVDRARLDRQFGQHLFHLGEIVKGNVNPLICDHR